MNGFILAGGRSTRMGSDKALLNYAGRPLIAHAVAVLQDAGLTPHILGTRPDLAGYAAMNPLSAYAQMASRTSFFMVFPMFPAL